MKRYVLLLVVLLACQDNEPDSPEVISKDAQQIGSTSVVMEAEIKEIGPVRPVNFGFLWDSQPDLSIAVAKNRVLLGLASAPRTFSIKQDNLTPSTVYYYRGFAANESYSIIYYANVVSFTTLP